jgi:hypothetical protein
MVYPYGELVDAIEATFYSDRKISALVERNFSSAITTDAGKA